MGNKKWLLKALDMRIGEQMIDLNKNKRFRRAIIFWVVLYITVFTVWTWIDPPNISTGLATVLCAMLALLGTVFKFYLDLRGKEENGNNNNHTEKR